MDSSNYSNYNYSSRDASASKLAGAAFVCGILSLIFVITGLLFPTFILGGISIILAILSRGRNPIFPSKAKIAIILASLGLVFNLLLCAVSTYMVLTNPALQNYIRQMYENIYGEPFPDDLFK